MVPLEELQALSDALVRARAAGYRSVEYEGKRIEYKSDAEMATALSSLNSQIAAQTGGCSRKRFVFSSTKGLSHRRNEP